MRLITMLIVFLCFFSNLRYIINVQFLISRDHNLRIIAILASKFLIYVVEKCKLKIICCLWSYQLKLVDKKSLSRPLQSQNDKQHPKIIVIVNTLQKFHLLVIPWRKPEPKIGKEASSSDYLVVTKCVKGEFSVVLSHPTFANSPKWKGISCKLHLISPTTTHFRMQKEHTSINSKK